MRKPHGPVRLPHQRRSREGPTPAKDGVLAATAGDEDHGTVPAASLAVLDRNQKGILDMTPVTRLRFATLPFYLLVGVGLPLASSALVRADDAPRPPNRQPPPAAFDACQQKKAGDACQVTFHEHTMDGLCHAAADDRLFCRPDHPRGPPPELKAACTDKKVGDACQATLHDHTVTGTCQQGHHDDGLICHGPHPQRPPAN